MHDLGVNLEADRARNFRRLLVISMALHGMGLAFVVLTPPLRPEISLPGVVSVELVAAPAAAKPKPRAQPRPKPKPPAPVKKKVVLPSKPSPPKPVAKSAPVPKPAPKPEPKPEPQAEYDDVLAQLRSEAGPKAPKPVVGGATTRSGPGVRISPEEAAWRRNVKIHVRQAWVLAPGFRTQRLQTLVVVQLDARGTVIGRPRVSNSSGNPWYDDSAVRAIEKASPLPSPPAAGEWEFQFRPEDYL